MGIGGWSPAYGTSPFLQGLLCLLIPFIFQTSQFAKFKNSAAPLCIFSVFKISEVVHTISNKRRTFQSYKVVFFIFITWQLYILQTVKLFSNPSQGRLSKKIKKKRRHYNSFLIIWIKSFAI